MTQGKLTAKIRAGERSEATEAARARAAASLAAWTAADLEFVAAEAAAEARARAAAEAADADAEAEAAAAAIRAVDTARAAARARKSAEAAEAEACKAEARAAAAYDSDLRARAEALKEAEAAQAARAREARLRACPAAQGRAVGLGTVDITGGGRRRSAAHAGAWEAADLAHAAVLDGTGIDVANGWTLDAIAAGFSDREAARTGDKRAAAAEADAAAAARAAAEAAADRSMQYLAAAGAEVIWPAGQFKADAGKAAEAAEAEADTGNQILRTARRMAARAADAVREFAVRRTGRAIVVSDASLADAEAAAAAELTAIVCGGRDDSLESFEPSADWRTACAAAWRAAFADLAGGRRRGFTGRHAEAAAVIDGEAAEVTLASLRAEADADAARAEADADARRAYLRRLWAAEARMRGAFDLDAADGRVRRAEVARFSMLCGMLRGQSWAEAAEAAGLTARSACESWRIGKVWQRLAKSAPVPPWAEAIDCARLTRAAAAARLGMAARSRPGAAGFIRPAAEAEAWTARTAARTARARWARARAQLAAQWAGVRHGLRAREHSAAEAADGAAKRPRKARSLPGGRPEAAVEWADGAGI